MDNVSSNPVIRLTTSTAPDSMQNLWNQYWTTSTATTTYPNYIIYSSAEGIKQIEDAAKEMWLEKSKIENTKNKQYNFLEMINLIK